MCHWASFEKEMIRSETGYGGEYNGEENRDSYGRIY